MSKFHPSLLKTVATNTLASVTNLFADLSQEKPEWIVIELSGSFDAREKKRKLTDFPPEFGPKDLTLETFEKSMAQLCHADWLKGVVFRFSDLAIDLATAYVMREQLTRLKKSGKELVAYTAQLGMASYYLASVANQIILPESAELNVLGFAVEQSYLKDTLSRVGLSAEKYAIKEYKTASDNLVESSMTEYQKEQLNALFDGFQDTMFTAIADSRNVTLDNVKDWVDAGISSALSAQEKGMIDAVMYEDEFMTDKHVLLEEAGRFLKTQRRKLKVGRVAVIPLVGTIMTGKSRKSVVPLPMVGGTFAGSDSIVSAFRAAEEDETTKAIVFYIDSGGGSALASDLMWREVKRIAAKKPIVAVMGQYAASGGYYVLTHANHVIAAPTTLTGSIGVVSVKLITAGFNEKYGIHVDAIQKGRYARLQSTAQPSGPDEKELMQRSIAEVYDRFISRVAEGRGLTKERVNELGRGRVWTGTAGLEHGLVDELGDLFTGIAKAKELAELANDAEVYNVEIPKKYQLPKFDSAEAIIQTLNPLLQEKVCLMQTVQLKHF